MANPVPGFSVSTPYGKRGSMWSCDEDSSGNGIHTGCDLAAPAGTPVVAPCPGQIRHRNYGSAFGNHQFVISPDPGQAFADGEIFFAHMTSRPADGVYVQTGDYLGKVGAEGNVSGPHLHMELHASTKGSWSCGVIDDPQPVLDYVDGDGNPSNPNGVKVGDLVLVTASSGLLARNAPGGDTVGSSLPYGAQFSVEDVVDGWALNARETAVSSSVKTAGNDVPLVPVYGTDYLHGWDISSNNPSSWTPADNETFGWVKATEGKSYVSPTYRDQLAEVRSLGQVVGHYHWLNGGDVDAQVDWFITNADVLPGELIAIDWENDTGTGTASCKQKDDAIIQLQDHYPANRVGLYCNRDFWLNKDTSSFFGDYLWIANYGPDIDEGPGIQADWFFWQWTSEPYDRNYGAFASLDTLKAWAGAGDAPPDPDPAGLWYSTDYLFPKLPNPANPNSVEAGQEVTVTAQSGLQARTLPGGPETLTDAGEPLVRPHGYEFTVESVVDGWAFGGTNYYSSDYLQEVEAPTKPGWSSSPSVILDDPTPDPNRNVSYLQACVRVAAMTDNNGKQWPEIYIVGQDLENKGNLRFACCAADGTYDGDWFMVNDAGHGQTFHAYRSAAGNLYVWCGENPAYRYKWQSGKTVSRTSGDKMDYKGSRPVGSYEPWVGFRDATDTRESFYLFDRTDFTDGTNRTTPAKSTTIAKQTQRSQQSWAVSEDRIYRLSGATNDDPPHGSMLHVLEVFNWHGTLLLTLDVTAMAISTTSDEPEGLTFSGTPGSLLAGKREGSTDPAKRSYPIWTITGIP